MPVFRIVALQALHEGRRHGAVEERIFAIDLLAAAPARIARQVGLRSPQHEDLPAVFRGLGDITRLVAFHAGGLLHNFRVPGFAHAGWLRKLGSGDRRQIALATAALDNAVNAFGTADITDAEARHAGLCAEDVDFLIDSHQGEDIVDALFGRQIRILERILILRHRWCGQQGTE